ncbi:DUF507 family protein [Campylobacter sp. US33a]|uniref:DUF507 family protein n=1 Tax=Campylobacter sp. CCS1377 TaxID=3158229 RepID=A0AAU7E8G3_9BACT|nr:DUF507 family protein [Campylobacter sp. US33a]MCW1359678.1 DUF507 family protein [Campylobacter jejuni]TEY04496.1 DUF507 family protein [Campylobacter sp. US33a]
MRIKLPHVPYICNKIVLDMVNSSFIEIKDNIDNLNKSAREILEQDLAQERKLDEKAKELLQEQEEEMELMQVDRKNMFWLVKKKLAPDFGVILNSEDRYNNLAHKILENFVENDYINFNVSENRVKNLIFLSIESYLKIYEDLEDEVLEKILNYKKKLIPGSEEYELVFEKLYQEELRKKGML